MTHEGIEFTVTSGSGDIRLEMLKPEEPEPVELMDGAPQTGGGELRPFAHIHAGTDSVLFMLFDRDADRRPAVVFDGEQMPNTDECLDLGGWYVRWVEVQRTDDDARYRIDFDDGQPDSGDVGPLPAPGHDGVYAHVSL